MNRAATSAVAQSVRWIRQRYNINAGDLKRQIKIIKARLNHPEVTLIFNKKPISLTYFKHRETKKGVIVTVKKSEPTLYRSQDNKRGSFIYYNNVSNKKRGVFIRTGEKRKMIKGRYKGKVREVIKKLFGPQAQQLLTSEQSLEKIEDMFNERFNIEFNREIEYRLNKLNV